MIQVQAVVFPPELEVHMMRLNSNSIPLTLAAAFLFAISPASGSDLIEPVEPTEEAELDGVSELAEEAKFGDRVLLVETLDRYGDTALAGAQADLTEAEQALADAILAEDQEQVDRLTNEVIPALEAEVVRDENFAANVAAIVVGMSDEQVVALNRALQNTRSNGIVPTIGLDELQRIVDESFDDRQIHAFVMAYRENAKFLAKADRFGVDSKQYDRAVAKAQSKQDKFLGKVDRFAADSTNDALAKSLAAKQTRKLARASALPSADLEAKHAAKGFAKNEARKTAKKQAVTLAKQDRASETKGLAKGKKK
jgi:hypothetical protein